MWDADLRPRFWVIGVATVAALIFVAVVVLESSSIPSTGPGTTPLAPYGFFWGQPMNASGTASPGCPSAIGHYCYSIEIAGVPGELSVRQVHLSLQTANGTALPWPPDPASDRVTLVAPVPTNPCAEYDTASSHWTPFGNFTGALSGGFTVVIFTGGVGASYGLSGDAIVYTGVDGSSGATPSATFP